MKKSGKLSMAQGGNAIGLKSVEMTSEDKEKALKVHNETIEVYKDVINEKIDKSLDEAQKLKEDLSKTELKPFGNYVLVKPYPTNPYRVMEKTESGILIDSNSGKGLNPNSGEIEEQDEFSRVGVVVEVNPDCTRIKPGDDVFYRKAQGVPIPFMGQGFEVVSEFSIQAIIGYELSKRWKELEESK